MRIETFMDLVIGGFQNEILKSKNTNELRDTLSRLKISNIVIKNKQTICLLNIKFIDEDEEKNLQFAIGFKPKEFEFHQENKIIKKIIFDNFKQTGNYYTGIVKIFI